MKRVLALIFLMILAAGLSSCAYSSQDAEVVPRQKEDVQTDEASLTADTENEAEEQPMTVHYTMNTKIEDVINDPVFDDYGRLIFPVNSGYYGGTTLGNLSLAWYNYVDSDMTVEISKMGYNAFALIYRPGAQTACEDLSRAIDFIFENADELEVDTDGYSLWGGSAGGRMADWVGTYGTEYFGEKAYPKPAAVIVNYTGLSEVTGYEPQTYSAVGTSDGIASWRTMKARLDSMSEMGIPTQFHSYDGLSHGFGLGTGTVAEGWINDAVAFWEDQMN